ncbi:MULTISPECIES: beta-ketoacyl-[acyl-carrier-protein] synthase family protein [Enterobacteriaceae]|uniref:beta-ketoacyl-[acyl-carrier-protein] synthase family protein n=1 Tax=Enterobacteriaceae TaxID=543 RepID=UPI0011754879|nr:MULTISPECIES: beta-ketoacyl-[acyl-carrier-protein] synthase family protein [Klebsiella]MCW9547279.1 beta-ketoacyl-[acyl-carrier-protein] synthase family protein [Klebsiella oxytoca]VUS46868.1 3-oxoacyl-[acyl-carrier-protein] synthase 2 [Klebsiella grimontii]
MSKAKNRVVISGIGIISAWGYCHNTFWRNLCAGRSAIKRLSLTEETSLPVRYGAPVDFELLTAAFPHLLPPPGVTDRRGVMGLIAANKAITDAGIKEHETQDMKMGVFACSGVVEIQEVDRALCAGSPSPLQTLRDKYAELSRFSGLTCPNDGMVVEIARRYRLTGPMSNVNAACSGGSHAIGLAYRAIQRGEADVMLAGGADSVLSLRTLIGLKLLGATATTEKWGETLCRPFDNTRSGLVAGEGAAFMILESEEHARQRGANIYAELKGYGSSLDAWKLTAPHPQGRGAEAAIREALYDSGLRQDQIQYINAHGTSTQLNDVIETAVIRRVFDGSAVPLVSSTKSMTGHWIAAAGAIEAVITALTLKHNFVPPTINLSTPDPECDLDYVANYGRDIPVSNAMSNSFGFGGINSCLVMGDYE